MSIYFVLVMSSCHYQDTNSFDVLIYVKLSLQRHLKQCHICIKNVTIERMALNDSCFSWNLLHIHDMCNVMIMKVSCLIQVKCYRQGKLYKYSIFFSIETKYNITSWKLQYDLIHFY